MLIRLFHRTTFVYEGHARDSFNEVRLCPVDDRLQRRRRFELRTHPASSIHPFTDYFGNAAHRFSVAAAHPELVVEAESEVETLPNSDRPAVPLTGASGPQATADFEAQVEFLQPSRYIPLDADLEDAVSRVLKGRTAVWQDVLRLCRHVHGTLFYRPQATGVDTLATDALRLRAGVCQDFAHVAIGLCRCAGIPARYVSGYFLGTERRPGETEASHAWIEACIPGFGWAAFDPTHDRPADERYVQIAVGRDYGDIRPVSGTYRGGATREFKVEVEVRSASAEAPNPAWPRLEQSQFDL